MTSKQQSKILRKTCRKYFVIVPCTNEWTVHGICHEYCNVSAGLIVFTEQGLAACQPNRNADSTRRREEQNLVAKQEDLIAYQTDTAQGL